MHTHKRIHIICSYLCTQIITLPFTFFLFPLLPQCEMNPDTGEPQDTVTKHTKQLIQALGSHNTKISEIVFQQDRAVFTAIQKVLDRVEVQKVCIPCNTLAELASLLFMRVGRMSQLLYTDALLSLCVRHDKVFSWLFLCTHAQCALQVYYGCALVMSPLLHTYSSI